MGVRFDKEHDMFLFTCDHPGCHMQATRKRIVRHYDRRTGQISTTVRNPNFPFPYWRKLLENPRSKGCHPFFLYRNRYGTWPEGVVVRCFKHRRLSLF